MVGVGVDGRSGVGCDLVLVILGTDRQRVADNNPAGRRFPGRDQDVRARLIDPRCRMVDPEGSEAKTSGLPVEQAAEHARRVRSGARRASRSIHPGPQARQCGSLTRTRNPRSPGMARAQPRSAPGVSWLPAGQTLCSRRRSCRYSRLTPWSEWNFIIVLSHRGSLPPVSRMGVGP